MHGSKEKLNAPQQRGPAINAENDLGLAGLAAAYFQDNLRGYEGRAGLSASPELSRLESSETCILFRVGRIRVRLRMFDQLE